MRWSTRVVVAVFVVVDVIVLGSAYALSKGRGAQDDPALTPAAPSASADPGKASDDASPDADTGGTGGSEEWTGPLALSASARGGVVRVTRGSCDPRFPTAARVWVAPTFKAPLAEVQVPGLQESLGVTYTDSELTVVGAGPKCNVFGFTSTDDGKSWKRGPVPDDVWYLDTDTTAGVVHGPVEGDEVSVDCTPVAVTTRDAGRTAYVSCTSQNVVVLDRDAEEGESPQAYSVTAPAASTDGPGDRPVAMSSMADCTASFVELEASQGASPQACLSKTDAALGLAVNGDRVWAQAGYGLYLSTDGGKKFSRYPGQ